MRNIIIHKDIASTLKAYNEALEVISAEDTIIEHNISKGDAKQSLSVSYIHKEDLKVRITVYLSIHDRGTSVSISPCIQSTKPWYNIEATIKSMTYRKRLIDFLAINLKNRIEKWL